MNTFDAHGVLASLHASSEEVRTDSFSWTDHAESFHPFPGVITRFILLGAGPSKDVFGQRSQFDLRQVDPVEEVLCPLPDPDSKLVLRCSQVLERSLEIIPLQVDDRLIPLRGVLQVRTLRPEARTTAECLVLASAWSQNLRDPGSPFLCLACPQGEDKSQ